MAVFSLSTMTCLSFAPATASSATAWVPSASAIVKFDATVPTTRERSKFFSGSAYLKSNDARPLVSPSTAAAAFADAFARPASSLARAASSYVSPSLLQAPGVSAAQMSTNRSWRGSGGAFAAAVLDASTARTADAAALPRVTDGNGRRVDQDGRLVFDQDGRRAVRLLADGVLSELKAYRVAAPLIPREATVALADGFYAKLKACDPSNSSRNGCKPLPAPLSIAILATVFTSDQKRHLANLDVLGESKEVRWTYAINAMDNDVGKWPRAAFVDRGVYFAAQASGRVEGTFQPRLLSQLPFTEALLDAVHLDYVWLIDGDISMKPLDVPALAASLPSATIGQTTINSAMSRHPTAGGNQGQYFYFLNTPTAEEARKRCGLTLLAVPFIEIQAPLLSTEFFAWYAPELREIAALQKREGSAWGPDTLWCGAAHRYAAARKEAAPPYPCAVLPTAVYHDDTRTIDKGGDFVARGQRTVAALQASHSRDYVGANEANGWWNSISWNCSRAHSTHSPSPALRSRPLRRRRAGSSRASQRWRRHRRRWSSSVRPSTRVSMTLAASSASRAAGAPRPSASRCFWWMRRRPTSRLR